MRVQPLLPSRPLTATVTSSAGAPRALQRREQPGAAGAEDQDVGVEGLHRPIHSRGWRAMLPAMADREVIGSGGRYSAAMLTRSRSDWMTWPAASAAKLINAASPIGFFARLPIGQDERGVRLAIAKIDRTRLQRPQAVIETQLLPACIEAILPRDIVTGDGLAARDGLHAASEVRRRQRDRGDRIGKRSRQPWKDRALQVRSRRIADRLEPTINLGASNSTRSHNEARVSSKEM